MGRGRPFSSLSASPEETSAIGRSLGRLLAPGDVIYIYGDIGAGKTVFVSGIASALNIGEYITSPTFTIMNMYLGDMPLCHCDAYRIESPAELYETGFFEFSGGEYVTAVEWAGRIKGYKPDKCIEVWIDPVEGCESSRDVRIIFNEG